MHLKMSPRLLKHFTKYAVKYKEETKLSCEKDDGGRWYCKADLDAFDAYLRAPWPKSKKAQRPSLPGKIKEEIMLEAACVCPVCGFESTGEAAHIEPVSKTQSHHPSNLIWLCPNHHTVVDNVAVASNVKMNTVRVLKEVLVDRQMRIWRLEHAATKGVLEFLRHVETVVSLLQDSNLRDAELGLKALAASELKALTKAAKKVAKLDVKESDTKGLSNKVLARKIAKASAKTKVDNPKSISTWRKDAARQRENYLQETGQVDCPLCDGDGVRFGDDCPLCNGESALPANVAERSDLSDFDEVDCPLCDGSGYLRGEPCQICDGDARMEKRFADRIEKTDYDLVDCPVCDGAGVKNGENCQFCSGECEIEAHVAARIDLSDYDLVDCRLCEGGGTHDGYDCPACGGEKKMPKLTAEQLDWSQFDLVDCPACSGTGQSDYGDCRTCDGERKVSRRFREQYS